MLCGNATHIWTFPVFYRASGKEGGDHPQGGGAVQITPSSFGCHPFFGKEGDVQECSGGGGISIRHITPSVGWRRPSSPNRASLHDALGRNPACAGGRGYISGCSIIWANSDNVVFVRRKTLPRVSNDNHRGCPYFDFLFDLLKVVGSNPAARAIPLGLI